MYEVEFMCPDGSELTLEINVENNDDKTIQKAIKPFLFKNYLSLLLREYTYDEIILLYICHTFSNSCFCRIL